MRHIRDRQNQKIVHVLHICYQLMATAGDRILYQVHHANDFLAKNFDLGKL
jgi:hypothetical protein